MVEKEDGDKKFSRLTNVNFHIKTEKSKLLEKHGFKKEEIEEVGYEDPFTYQYTGFPHTNKRYNLVWEKNNFSLEEPYFWVLEFLRTHRGISNIIKVDDVFTAAENSALFGVSQVRLGGQQDKISNYLVSIGKMVQDLFKLVREIRLIDERLYYYNHVEEELKKKNIMDRKKGADITLKGIYIDFVQGGSKSPASIYGMAQQVGFISLPDIYFDAPPMDDEEIDDYVNALEKDFNLSVLRVLKRTLYQYSVWRKRTYGELKVRKKFNEKYLKQHYDIIRMYLAWIKPYLRHVEKLTMSEKSYLPDIITTFEGSLLDVELMALIPHDKVKDVFGVVLITFNYRTRPHMNFQQEGYQRGPVHVGRMEMFIRSYGWSKQDVENYLSYRKEEEWHLLRGVTHSVEESMEALGEELKEYLNRSKDKIGEDKDKDIKSEKQTFLQKMFGIEPKKKKEEEKSKVLKELFHDWFGIQPNENKISSKKQKKINDAKADMEKKARLQAYVVYKVFKKGHRMHMW